MKKIFTRMMVMFLALMGVSFVAKGQINLESPVPVDVVVNSPASINGYYDYGTSTLWGPTLTTTVTGDLTWVYGPNPLGTPVGIIDSLGCAALDNDLTGKMALIRRGLCNFSLKAYSAQQAGAVGAVICNHYTTAADEGGTVYNMSAGDSAVAVTIPAIFLSRTSCEQIVPVVDAGGTVNISFVVRAFANPVAAYAYKTPQSEIIPLEDIGVRFITLDSNILDELTVTVAITNPAGQTTTITETMTEVPGLTVNDIVFTDAYIPEEQGVYTLVYSNSENGETLNDTFEISDNVYAQDHGPIVDWIAERNDSFAIHGFNYDFGNYYRTGATEQTAPSMMFMLANPDSLYTGDADADKFEIRLYDADPDGDGVINTAATNYADFNGEVFAGFADYSLTGEEEPYEPIVVNFEEPVILEPNKIYLLMVKYNGLNAGLGISPWYAFAGLDEVAGGAGSAVFTDRLYTAGWNPPYRGVIRLNLETESGTQIKLDETKITLSPNPATTHVKLELALEQQAKEVVVNIFNSMGMMIYSQQLNNVQEGAFNFDVSSLSTGTYYMQVNTPEGYRTKKFQVIR